MQPGHARSEKGKENMLRAIGDPLGAWEGETKEHKLCPVLREKGANS